MKKLITLLAFLFATVVWAEGDVFDPTLPDQDTLTVSCKDPIKRTDGTDLAVGEIATRKFWVSTDKVTWTPAGENTTECKQVYDLTQVTDNQYYYTMSAVDTDGRESIKAFDKTGAPIVDRYYPMVVKRIKPPEPPTGFSGSVS